MQLATVHVAYRLRPLLRFARMLLCFLPQRRALGESVALLIATHNRASVAHALGPFSARVPSTGPSAVAAVLREY